MRGKKKAHTGGGGKKMKEKAERNPVATPPPVDPGSL